MFATLLTEILLSFYILKSGSPFQSVEVIAHRVSCYWWGLDSSSIFKEINTLRSLTVKIIFFPRNGVTITTVLCIWWFTVLLPHLLILNRKTCGLLHTRILTKNRVNRKHWTFNLQDLLFWCGFLSTLGISFLVDRFGHPVSSITTVIQRMKWPALTVRLNGNGVSHHFIMLQSHQSQRPLTESPMYGLALITFKRASCWCFD